MKQVLQNYGTGEIWLADVPAPRCRTRGLLVRNRNSLISIGTERSIIELGKKSLVGKAAARPDLVKRAIEKARSEGLVKTFQEAMGRLDVPTPLGYSSAGIVEEAGSEAHGFAPGDRVACIGAGVASHAEFISVPINLACKIPDTVSDEEASFGMLGIIALHGVRCAHLSFGSTVAVVGLGLLGLLTVQLLKAYGCRVAVTDLSEDKVAFAKALGADVATSDTDVFAAAVADMTDAYGADSVIITAATKSSQPVNMAVDLSKIGGKIVLVGVADIHPDRNEMWHKEVEIVVSKAAGPGSLDPDYENGGHDYPFSYVRWTENRNLEEFLRLVGEGRVDLKPLITHHHDLSEALGIYEEIHKGTLEDAVGIILSYDCAAEAKQYTALTSTRALSAKDMVTVSTIGAGLFGKALLLPALSRTKDVQLKALATSTGANATHSGQKFGFTEATTDAKSVFLDKETDAIVALTPHNMHAGNTLDAIEHGKHLFIEKPLCTTPEELDKIRDCAAAAETLPVIMIGHNRRYSSHTDTIRKWLKDRSSPLVMTMRVNAGFVPADHWVHSDAEGRSRIVGEVSHFVDFMEAVIGAAPVRVSAERIDGNDKSAINNDNFVASFRFADGSVASLTYSASGDRSFSREEAEIFWDSNTILTTDFKLSKLFSKGRKTQFKTCGQALGYKEELDVFVGAARGASDVTVPNLAQSIHTMAVIFAIEDALATGKTVSLLQDR